MTIHMREELERIGRQARRDFSQALMSDAKWRKLFAAIDDAGLAPEQAIAKFIDVPDPKAIHFPGRGALCPPWPYVDSFEFGPIELRAIEWLMIPRTARIPRDNNLPARSVEQDVEAIYDLVTTLGRYPLERSDDGLRIVGYRR